MKTSIDYTLRFMCKRDFLVIYDLEDESFEFPWNKEKFNSILKPKKASKIITYTIEAKEEVIGYYICEIINRRMEILNFCVNAENRRNGIGSEILKNIKNAMKKLEVDRIIGLVHENSLFTHLFFKKHGFKWIQTCKNKENGQDYYLFDYFRPDFMEE